MPLAMLLAGRGLCPDLDCEPRDSGLALDSVVAVRASPIGGRSCKPSSVTASCFQAMSAFEVAGLRPSRIVFVLMALDALGVLGSDMSADILLETSTLV